MSVRLDSGQVPSELRFGEKFIGKRFPFGANVLYWAPQSSRRLGDQSSLVLESKEFVSVTTFSLALCLRLSIKWHHCTISTTSITL